MISRQNNLNAGGLKNKIRGLLLKKHLKTSEGISGGDAADQQEYEEINKMLLIDNEEANIANPADLLISRFPLFGITSAFKKTCVKP